MTTALQIVTEALGLVGVASPGQDIENADSAFTFERLNELIDAWATSRLYAASASHAVYTVSGTVSTVTVGPGRNIDTTRPVRIADGFVRRGGYDYPFQMVDRATYDAFQQKGFGTYTPDIAWYDGDHTITFAPPLTGGEVHIPVEGGVLPFATLASAQTLPQGYQRALALTLAEEIAPHYSRELSRSVVQRAINARRAIKRANHSPPILSGLAARPRSLFAGAFDASTAVSAPAAGRQLYLDASAIYLDASALYFA